MDKQLKGGEEIMNKKQTETIKENMDFLKNVLLEKKDLYPITVTDSNGKREELINREEYLEFVVCVVFESLAEAFPKLEEI